MGMRKKGAPRLSTLRHRPYEVTLESKLEEFYHGLDNEDSLKVAINKCIDALDESMFSREQIKKRQIPKYYVIRFGVTNLYRFRLDRARRASYTIVSMYGIIKVIVLEVFPDHKSYERRFHYSG